MNCIDNCEICGGIGWVRAGARVGEPGHGKVEACPNQRKYLIEHRHFKSSIGVGIEEAKTLDWRGFDQTEAVVSMRKAMNHVLERESGFLYIWGAPGIGKTIMGKAFALQAGIMQALDAHYTVWGKAMNDLRSSFDYDHGQLAFKRLLEYYQTVQVLVIDELNRDRPTDFSRQNLSEIMNARYESACAGKTITIWICNYKPEAQESGLEPYQIDRIRDARFSVLQVGGVSYRRAAARTLEAVTWWE